MKQKQSVTAAQTQPKVLKNKAKLPDDFKSVARRLECDEDKEQFENALGRIAKATIKTAAARKRLKKSPSPRNR